MFESVINTSVLIAAVDDGDLTRDFYPVKAWLRDTCIPAVRPLYNELCNVDDHGLKAVALLEHTMTDGSSVYELLIHHGCFEKRIRATVPRHVPTLADFVDYARGR